MNRRRASFALCVVAFVWAVSACGVGAESRPRVIDRTDVPFGLTRGADGGPATTTESGSFTYTLYFVSGDQLTAVIRHARRERSATEILQELVAGPARGEAGARTRTLLQPDLSIDQVVLDGDLATLRLSGAEAARSGSQQPLAIAQLVYSATALPGVDRVRFEVDGHQAEVPRGDGTLVKRAVARDDYLEAAP